MSLVPNYHSSDYESSSDSEPELFQTVKPSSTNEKLKILLPKALSDSESDSESETQKKLTKNKAGAGSSLQDLLPEVQNKKQVNKEEEKEEDKEKKPEPSKVLGNSVFIPNKVAKSKVNAKSKALENEDFNLFPVGKASINAYSKVASKSAIPARIHNNSYNTAVDYNQSQITEQQSSQQNDASEPQRDEELEKFIYGRKKRGAIDSIQIQDINANDGLTSPESQVVGVQTQSSFTKISTMLPPSSNMKRRNNIMFLAQQSKLNEKELMESYAQAKKTKKETRSKYGF